MPNHKLQQKARSTAVWEPRYCRKDYCDWQMERIPPHAIGADMTKHASHGSYGPLFWYEDQEYKCLDCGQEQVWTAKEQQWWFEVAKGPIYARAIRCRACRKALKERTGKLSHAERRAKSEAKH